MGKAEGIVEDYLVEQAEKHGFLCWKYISPSQSGVPDRTIVGKPFGTVYVECKSATGKTRKLQDVVIEKLRAHGALVYVVNTKEAVDELISELVNFKKKKKSST